MLVPKPIPVPPLPSSLGASMNDVYIQRAAILDVSVVDPLAPPTVP